MSKHLELFYFGNDCVRTKIAVDLVVIHGQFYCMLTDPEDNTGDKLAWSFAKAASISYHNLFRHVPQDMITWLAYFPLGKRYSAELLKKIPMVEAIKLEDAAGHERKLTENGWMRYSPYRIVRLEWNGEWFTSAQFIEAEESLVKKINEEKTNQVTPGGVDIFNHPQRFTIQGLRGMGNFGTTFGVRAHRDEVQGRIVAVLSQQPESTTSITNTIELAASFVLWNYLPGYSPDQVIFVECYPENDEGKGKYTQVDFEWDTEYSRYVNPRWEPLAEDIRKIIGEGIYASCRMENEGEPETC